MENKSDLPWIYYVARRFSLVDRRGAGAFSSRLSSLGICFGVMTLIIVISVMNGFQSEFIDAIMEVSSYHVRVAADEDKNGVKEFLDNSKSILSYSEFIESESLVYSESAKQAALFVRGVDSDIMERDSGFKKELKIVRGSFDLDKKFFEDGETLEPIVLGSPLARSLGARLGDKVSLCAINSGRPLLESITKAKRFVVAGLFMTGYADINSAYAFVQKDSAKEFFSSSPEFIGIKLKKADFAPAFAKELQAAFPKLNPNPWQDYNRSFFSVLKVEKNMLMLLVVLIFLVVAINIFNSMRRIVFERRFEISTLSALGGNISSIKNIFIMRGFLTGVRGAFPGLLLGIFFCVNIKSVFALLSKAIYYVQAAFALFFRPELLATMHENPMFAIYGNIPARMRFSEIAFISFFGILSAALSSWAASREILAVPVSEVLHDE